MSDFLIEHAGPILNELHGIATEHTAASEGKLALLDYDPDKYLMRDILKHTIKGTALDPIKANELASSVDSRYQNLYTATEQCAEVEVIEDVLMSGHSVILAMDHDELVDAALRPLALANIIKLRNPGLIDKRGRPFFRTGLIVSRMIEFVGVPMMGGIVPAKDLFSIGFDYTHQTIPSTISTKNRFDKRAITAYNGVVVREIAGNLQHGAFSNRRPMLLAMAAPGTINKPLDYAKYVGGEIPEPLQQSTIVIGQINYRIADFANKALTFASVGKMGTDKSQILIDGIPLCVGGAKDIERLAAKLITLTSKLGDQNLNYIYDTDGNLPVIKK